MSSRKENSLSRFCMRGFVPPITGLLIVLQFVCVVPVLKIASREVSAESKVPLESTSEERDERSESTSFDDYFVHRKAGEHRTNTSLLCHQAFAPENSAHRVVRFRIEQMIIHGFRASRQC